MPYQKHAVTARRHPPGDALDQVADEQLVHAARRGEKRAFVETVARHQAMVCGVALGILGNFAASEDPGQGVEQLSAMPRAQARSVIAGLSWLPEEKRSRLLEALSAQ